MTILHFPTKDRQPANRSGTKITNIEISIQTDILEDGSIWYRIWSGGSWAEWIKMEESEWTMKMSSTIK